MIITHNHTFARQGWPCLVLLLLILNSSWFWFRRAGEGTQKDFVFSHVSDIQ